MVKKKTAEPPKRGRGRPATGRKREVKMVIRMTEDERSILDAAAAKEAMAPTVWALASLLAVAKITK